MMVRDDVFGESLAPAMMSVTGGKSPSNIAMDMAALLLGSLKDACPRDVWAAAHAKTGKRKYEVRWRLAKDDPQVAPMTSERLFDAWQYAAYQVYRTNGRLVSLEVWWEEEG